MESASAVSAAPRVAKPSWLRASKKLCVRGGVLSLMTAAGGVSKACIGARLLLARKSLLNDGAVGAGVIASVPAGAGSAVLISAEIGGASGRAATSVWGEMEVVPGAAFAVEAEAGTAEAEAEAGVRRASSPRAKADDPKNTNSMAATATLTSLPPDVSFQNACSSRLNNSLNVGFYWQFLLQMLRVEIGPATEIRGLRALPERDRRNTCRRFALMDADCFAQKCKSHHGWTTNDTDFKFKLVPY